MIVEAIHVSYADGPVYAKVLCNQVYRIGEEIFFAHDMGDRRIVRSIVEYSPRCDSDVLKWVVHFEDRGPIHIIFQGNPGVWKVEKTEKSHEID